MKIIESAKCDLCTDSLGRPIGVEEDDGEEFTLYECSCGNQWLRPH